MATSSSIDPLLLASSKAKGKRPQFLENADTERLMNMVLALVQEVSVLRQRLDTVERLLEADQKVTRASIEGFEPTKAEAAERGLWTQEYLNRIFRILQQEREALEANDQYSEEVAEELAKT
jgi:hypothetical protein